MGGGSPIRRLTEAQAAALRRALGAELPVYVGMRHWHPYIAETVERIVTDGRHRLVAIALAPHYSAMSVGAYEAKLAEAAAGRLDVARSEEHTSELQSPCNLVCRLLLEKKKK